ncbi:uncharacterized protein [Diadema antillarum]|uniref:uncharacterized protein n=1 Tax=Diadema antillarum TaxID=105358 RepID=UPI003A890B7F
MQELFPQFEEGTRVTGLGHTWTLAKVLGMGRCAKVYHMSTNEGSIQAAVKVYRKEEKYRLAFIKEVYNLDAVYGDRRIISVYGTFTHKGHPCLAMELLDFNLKEFIYQSENCTISQPTVELPQVVCNNNNNILTAPDASVKDRKSHPGGGGGTAVTVSAASRSKREERSEEHPTKKRKSGAEGQGTQRRTRQSTRGQSAGGADPPRTIEKPSQVGSSSSDAVEPSGRRSRDVVVHDDAKSSDHGDSCEGNEEDADDDGDGEVSEGGENLANYGLSLYMMQKLLRDVASCLQFIQTCGWVHGDLKPANIMWSSQEGSWKIVDFGHSFQEGHQDFSQIQSLCYQSPEAKIWNAFVSSLGNQRGVHKLSAVDEGVPECTHAADIWSLGCVVVGAYTGIKLYGQDDVLPGACRQCRKASLNTSCECEPLVESLFKPKMTHPKFSSSHRAAVRKLLDLVKSMLQCDIQRRPSAAEILAHPFFSSELTPSAKDLLLLPMRTLRLSILASSTLDLTNQKVFSSFYQEVKRECLKFGPIKTLVIPKEGSGKGMAFVEFEDAADTKAANSALMAQKIAGHTTLTSYFPVDDFTASSLY